MTLRAESGLPCSTPPHQDEAGIGHEKLTFSIVRRPIAIRGHVATGPTVAAPAPFPAPFPARQVGHGVVAVDGKGRSVQRESITRRRRSTEDVLVTTGTWARRWVPGRGPRDTGGKSRSLIVCASSQLRGKLSNQGRDIVWRITPPE